MNDEQLSAFFKGNQPQPSDSEKFMRNLMDSVNAVSELKEYHREQVSALRRKMRIAIFLSAVIGTLVAVVFVVFAAVLPKPDFSFTTVTDAFSRYYVYFIIAALTLGIALWRTTHTARA